MRPQPPSGPVESLSGLIERVTFHNNESGFAVFKVKAKGHRDLVTVVGSLASVSAVEWLTAEGRWVQDREFGVQFRAAPASSMLENAHLGFTGSSNTISSVAIGPSSNDAPTIPGRFGASPAPARR